MKRLIVCLFLASLFLQVGLRSETKRLLPLQADLSFLIVDLKFTEDSQVKICEIQPGSYSVFSGYDFLNGADGLVPSMFYDFLTRFQQKVWYIETDVADSKMRRLFAALPWSVNSALSAIVKDPDFLEAAATPPADPHNLEDYHGILYTRNIRIDSIDDFYRDYPGVLLMDAAIMPYSGDKLPMTRLMEKGSLLKNMKPRWNSYTKKYSKDLAKRIAFDLKCNTFVIKPRKSTKGYGVLIVDRGDLDSTLKYILDDPQSRLGNDPDISYSYWKRDKSPTFIVEEFIPSLPVASTYMGGGLYDGTMRCVFFFYYDRGEMGMEFLEGHWKLPKKAIDEEGTMTEKHKSFGETPHFELVDPVILDLVQRQLAAAMPFLYSQMLGIE